MRGDLFANNKSKSSWTIIFPVVKKKGEVFKAFTFAFFFDEIDIFFLGEAVVLRKHARRIAYKLEILFLPLALFLLMIWPGLDPFLRSALKPNFLRLLVLLGWYVRFVDIDLILTCPGIKANPTSRIGFHPGSSVKLGVDPTSPSLPAGKAGLR